MMMRLGLIAVSGIAILMFQNCGKSLPVNPENGASLASQKVEDGPLLAAKTFYLTNDPSLLSDNETLMRQGLKLDVSSGVILNQADQDSPDGLLKAGRRYCLTAAERDELLALTSKDSVCKGLNPMGAGDYCAMAMQLPYALYGSKSQALTEIGSAACLKAPDIDFCEGQGERVADLLDQVLQTIDQRTCSSL